MRPRLPPGTRLGDVEILDVIGDGGFGTVYRARQVRLAREVAVKVLSPALLREDARAAERFEREVELVRRLEHPNIVRLYDTGRDDAGLVWMVMALVRGESLAQHLASDGPMPVARVVPIVRQLLSALAVAHDAGVVHRDLKPHNIMLEAQVGIDRDHVTLLDFGIGKLLERRAGPDLRATLTARGAMLGTPMYMAPEQLAGAPVTAAADVYAVGLVTLELLTGVPPFAGDTVMEILQSRTGGVVIPAGLDLAVERFICACTADDPAARPAGARACAELLARCMASDEPETLSAAPGSTHRIAGWDDDAVPGTAGPAAVEGTLDGFLTGNDARDSWGSAGGRDDDLELFEPGLALDAETGETVTTAVRDEVPGTHDEVPGTPEDAVPGTRDVVPGTASEVPGTGTIASPPPPMGIESFAVTSLAEARPQRVEPTPPPAPRPMPVQRGYGRLLGFVLAIGIVGGLVVLAIDAFKDAPATVETALDGSEARAAGKREAAAEGITRMVMPVDAEPVYRSSVRGAPTPTARPSRPVTSLDDDDEARACDEGRLAFCVSLGRRLASAQGPARDEARAAALFTRACDGGVSSGCGNLAALMVEGRGVEYDPEGAAELAAQACDDDHAASCFNLGSMYEAGMGVGESQRQAGHYFERACHLGFDDGCRAIGE